MPLPKEQRRYTYQDYLTWPEEERWELIDGIAYDMTPAPTFFHQTIINKLTTRLTTFLKNRPCITGIAPTDVYLSENDLVQPDVFVICDKSIITKEKINGVPDVIFEVLSPSTAKKDRWEKKHLYEKYGVKEYILIDQDALYAEQFILMENGQYHKGDMFEAEDTITLHTLPDIEIPLAEIFEFV